jgi:hypothetical protein
MLFENVNTEIQRLGYQPIDSVQMHALHNVLGDAFETSLEQCSRLGRDSTSWDLLRSSLMAVSPLVTRVVTELNLVLDLPSRLRLFLEAGKPLRAAIAAYSATESDNTQRERAGDFIRAIACKDALNCGRAVERQIALKTTHVYAAKAAVTFEYAQSRDARSCMQIEAAGREDRSQLFNWQKKIIIQLSDAELMQVLAVLRNWMPSVEFSNHGAGRDKRLTLTRQSQGGYLASVRQGTVARVVPIPTFEAYKVVSIGMRVLIDNSPHLNASMISEVCQEMAESQVGGPG